MSDPVQTIQHLAERLGAGLRAQHLVLTTAESCTAGGIGYAVTLVPGSSAWYDRGFITYSNESKMQVLGVSAAYLRDFGAVSEPVARAMAFGALSHSAAQVALAVTGIAGPDGGTPEKPVGTVYLALADREGCTVRRCLFSGSREEIRTVTAITALDWLRRRLSGTDPSAPLRRKADVT